MNRSSLVFLLAAALLMGVLFALTVEDTPEPEVEAESRFDESSNVKKLTFRHYDPKDVVVEYDEFDEAVPFALGENFVASDRDLKHETLEIELDRDGSIEYKVEMAANDAVVYQWSVVAGEVYYDFHGHPHKEDTEFFNRYTAGEGASDSGMIVAAFAGQHGWFWLNISEGPIVIELKVSGFFDRIVAIPIESY